MRPLHQCVAVVIAFAVGACSSANEAGIAQLTAEELNLRIPDEQSAAFADGTISGDEVRAAFSFFEECAAELHADSLSASLTEEYEFQMTFEPEDRERIEDCRIVHFEATYLVFASQDKVAEAQRRDG